MGSVAPWGAMGVGDRRRCRREWCVHGISRWRRGVPWASVTRGVGAVRGACVALALASVWGMYHTRCHCRRRSRLRLGEIS